MRLICPPRSLYRQFGLNRGCTSIIMHVFCFACCARRKCVCSHSPVRDWPHVGCATACSVGPLESTFSTHLLEQYSSRNPPRLCRCCTSPCNAAIHLSSLGMMQSESTVWRGTSRQCKILIWVKPVKCLTMHLLLRLPRCTSWESWRSSRYYTCAHSDFDLLCKGGRSRILRFCIIPLE